MDAGTTGIIKAIEGWAGTLAKWAGGFTTWFLAFLGCKRYFNYSDCINVRFFRYWNFAKINTRILVFFNP
ncbi:hypothetical protein [Spiroplasma phoeniceum]|uniref:Spiroplasma plectrovirus-related protein n=1 Tax=Spiroplasma phoeniceum P40 TaxID=1276259 RepID=A0A345DP73_9MOLU|nr:hypothetical protein [Spiroplasma phoeniceum]AXF96011.1 spiroplasma plectrovirus-related protein [Spiroplasma phoeniceum P40]